MYRYWLKGGDAVWLGSKLWAWHWQPTAGFIINMTCSWTASRLGSAPSLMIDLHTGFYPDAFQREISPKITNSPTDTGVAKYRNQLLVIAEPARHEVGDFVRRYSLPVFRQ